MCEEFESDGSGFLEWMTNNPNGFVANTGKTESSREFVLHESGCLHIRSHSNGPQALVRNRNKVCAQGLSELKSWASTHRRGATPTRCGNCNPA